MSREFNVQIISSIDPKTLVVLYIIPGINICWDDTGNISVGIYWLFWDISIWYEWEDTNE